MSQPPACKRPRVVSRKWRTCIDTKSVMPSDEYLASFCFAYANYAQNDHVIAFQFPSHYSTPDVFIHESRLKWIGGPFNAMISTGFQEEAQRKVSLPDEDDPGTFEVIRDFLYCKRICLRDRTLKEMSSIIYSAHRWQLVDLFEVMYRHICKNRLLVDTSGLIAIAGTISLPEVPSDFKDYFWERAGFYYDRFCPRDALVKKRPCRRRKMRVEDVSSDSESKWNSEGDVDDSDESSEDADRQSQEVRNLNEEECIDSSQEAGVGSGVEKGKDQGGNESIEGQKSEEKDDLPTIEQRLCPLFPEIWDLAISHGVITNFIEDIVAFSAQNQNALKSDLMHLVLQYIEPRVANDTTMVTLMEVLFSDFMQHEQYLERAEYHGGCSIRAMRLFMRTLSAYKRAPQHSITHGWPIPPSRQGITVSREYYFSYGMLGDGKGLISSDPRILDPVAHGLNFKVKMKVHSTKRVDYAVRWSCGPRFPLVDRLLKLRVAVVADNNYCLTYRRASAEYLADDCVRRNLICDSRKLEGCIPEPTMLEYYKRHRSCIQNIFGPCVPTLWVEVEIVD